MSSLTDDDESINAQDEEQPPRIRAVLGGLLANLPRIRMVGPWSPWAITLDSWLELAGSALFYAQRGWPVFPCTSAKRDGTRGKSPRVKDWQNLASVERVQILRWWDRWPDSNVGVVCGPRSGLLIIDVDYKPDRGIDGWASLRALEAVHRPLPVGPRVRRGTSSTHLYFAYDERLRNYVGHLPGIDVRTSGGLVIGALSFHAASGDRYLWQDGTAELPLPAIPEWLVEALSKPGVKPTKTKQQRAPAVRASNELPRAAKAYAAAALQSETEKVASAEEGTRNVTLNNAAFAMGTLVGANAIDSDDIFNALLDAALECGLSEEEAERTISSGLQAGERQPRDLGHLGRASRQETNKTDDEIEEDLP